MLHPLNYAIRLVADATITRLLFLLCDIEHQSTIAVLWQSLRISRVLLTAVIACLLRSCSILPVRMKNSSWIVNQRPMIFVKTKPASPKPFFEGESGYQKEFKHDQPCRGICSNVRYCNRRSSGKLSTNPPTRSIRLQSTSL